MDPILDWSNLPDEIWMKIGKGLDNRLDVLRFRSVCKLWRSSIPPFHTSSPPPLCLKFPYPFPTRSDVFVSSHSFYRIELAHDDVGRELFTSSSSSPPPPPLAHDDVGRELFTSSSSSSPPPPPPPFSSCCLKGSLVKVEELEPGKLRLLDPFSSCRIRDLPDKFSKAFSLLEFRMIELAKAYALRYVCGSSSIPGTNKVIISPNCGSHTVDESSSIFVIYDQGKLGFAKNEDENITLIDEKVVDYNDMIVHKGQVYVVDRWGTVSWVDSSLRVIQFSPLLFGFGDRKHLVVSCGELYVVDRYLDREDNTKDPSVVFYRHPLRRRRYEFTQAKAIDFKVYKLDEEWGRWVEVKNLGDQAFILSIDCSLSISAHEFSGIKENCIYFTEQLHLDLAIRGLGNHDVSIYDLEHGHIKKLDSSPGFCPPSWFFPKNQSCSD